MTANDACHRHRREKYQKTPPPGARRRGEGHRTRGGKETGPEKHPTQGGGGEKARREAPPGHHRKGGKPKKNQQQGRREKKEKPRKTQNQGRRAKRKTDPRGGGCQRPIASWRLRLAQQCPAEARCSILATSGQQEMRPAHHPHCHGAQCTQSP